MNVIFTFFLFIKKKKEKKPQMKKHTHKISIVDINHLFSKIIYVER